jgi:hypothetical protein
MFLVQDVSGTETVQIQYLVPDVSGTKPAQLGFRPCIAASIHPQQCIKTNSTPYQRGFAAMLRIPGVRRFWVENAWFGGLWLRASGLGFGLRAQGSGLRVSLICLRRLESSPGPNVNFSIFQLGRMLMGNSRKYTSLSGLLSCTN